MSESDEEGDTKPKGEAPAAAETSANSNARLVPSFTIVKFRDFDRMIGSYLSFTDIIG